MPQEPQTFGQLADAGLRAHAEFLTTENPERKALAGQATAQWAGYLQANEFNPQFSKHAKRFLRELDFSRLEETGELEQRRAAARQKIEGLNGQLEVLGQSGLGSIGQVQGIESELQAVQGELRELDAAGRGLDGLRRRSALKSALKGLSVSGPSKAWEDYKRGRVVDGAAIEAGFWGSADNKYELPDEVFNAPAFG